jgi:hypothetical protein
MAAMLIRYPAIKTADQLLKKNPNHGDTEAMKALTLNAQGQTDEGISNSRGLDIC